ncbi:MAG: tripartite tricarboxylate transporter substrate binding protein, partial [Burkholderiales bacterium]
MPHLPGLTHCFSRRLVITALLASAFSVQAQSNWPERPVRLIVPFPAGGATDLIARVIAQRVSTDIGQPLVVDN